MIEVEKVSKAVEISRDSYLIELIKTRDYCLENIETYTDALNIAIKAYNKVVTAMHNIRETEEMGLKAKYYIDDESNQVLMMCEGKKTIGFKLPHCF
jgi:hypothetical protein